MIAAPFLPARPGRGHLAPPQEGIRPADTTDEPLPGIASPPSPADPAPAAAVLGTIAPHVRPGVTDLLLDGRGALWADAGNGVRPVEEWRALDPEAARRLAVSLVARGGRHLDDATPCVDVRLAGGFRVHAVLPPVTTGGPVVSIRIARRDPWRMHDLLERGMLEPCDADRLVAAVLARRNLLICGPAGSGKTSLLAALLAEAPATDRIVTIEDVAELSIDHPHVVGLEARQANADGVGGIGLDRLVREALRMRPDRLVLGECRGAEVADLLAALNTGHDGGAGTLHSTALADVPARLEALGALAGLGPEALCRQALSAIDLVVHLGREDGRRVMRGFGRLRADERDRLAVDEVHR